MLGWTYTGESIFRVVRSGEAAMIFFDIDGTLLDFKGAERAGVMAIYSEFGWRLPMDADVFYEAWCRVGEKHFQLYLQGKKGFVAQQKDRVLELFGLASVTLSESQAKGVFAHYLAAFENNWALFGDVLPCLKGLYGQHRLGIITNGHRGQQHKKLAVTGIRDFFDVVVCSGEIGYAKPDPRIYETAAKWAGVALGECVYVGDNYSHDIEASRRAGMQAIWICRKPCDPMTKTADGPIIRSLNHVLGYNPSPSPG